MKSFCLVALLFTVQALDMQSLRDSHAQTYDSYDGSGDHVSAEDGNRGSDVHAFAAEQA